VTGKWGGGVDNNSDKPVATPLAADFILPLLACGLTAYFFVNTVDLVWEAKATGIFIGIILALLCVAHMVRMALRIMAGRNIFSFGELFDNHLFNQQRLALFGLMVLFIVTLPWVGTTLGLILLLAGSMLVMGVRDIRPLLGVSFVTAGTVYVLLIYLLGSRLPQGPVEKFLGWLTSLGGAA
jgi:hypothetical protein